MATSFTSRNAEDRSYDQLWTHRGNKFVIGTVHGEPIEIVAQYNPKELSRQATAEWNDNPNTSAKQSPTGNSQRYSEYGTSQPRTVTLELLFDGYEEGLSVAGIVEDLENLTLPVDMKAKDTTKRRPQLCVAVWGKQQLRCVVTSVATKLTMFDLAGKPLRAICTISLKEADVASMMDADLAKATGRISEKGGGYDIVKPDHTRNPYPPEDMKPTRLPAFNPATAKDITAAAGIADNNRQSASAGSTSSKKQTAEASSPPAATEQAPAAAAPAAEPTPDPAADGPIVTNPTTTNSAPKESNEGEPAAVGKPSADVNPEVYDNPDAPVFKTVGKPSAGLDPASKDDPDGPRLLETPSDDADAVSSADGQDPDAKRMRVQKELE